MKRLIYGLLLCFMIATSQVAWADTSSTGATTNTQTNTSGSNTISGGYSQESTTTYQSGSSSNTTSTTNNNSYTGDTRVANSASTINVSNVTRPLRGWYFRWYIYSWCRYFWWNIYHRREL